jgi:hypothetical protein
MILIISPHNDGHALCVAQDLAAMGKPFRIVDTSRLSQEGRLEFRAGQRSDSTWTCVDGKPISLKDIETVGHRRRFLPIAPDLPDINDRNFIRREWTEMISGLFSTLDTCSSTIPFCRREPLSPSS